MEGDLQNEVGRHSSKKISLKALKAEIGPKAVRSILGKQYKNGIRKKEVMVPRHEDLMVGDVILTKSDRRKGVHRAVSKAQREHDRDNEASEWTHAMLYVGNLHVLEARVWSFLDRRDGVRLAPLALTRDESTEFLVLRHKSPFYADRRFALARRALLDSTLFPQKYGFLSAIAAARDVVITPKSETRVARPVDLGTATTCSEYVLDCLAMGAQTLVEQHESIHDPDVEMHFFPADLFLNENFEQMSLPYYELEEES